MIMMLVDGKETSTNDITLEEVSIISSNFKGNQEMLEYQLEIRMVRIL